MKNWKKGIIFIFMVYLSSLFISPIFANTNTEIEFKSIESSNIEDGKATIKWVTNDQTKGLVYFGDNVNSLSRNTGYSRYDYIHEVVLTGLQKKKTYYYKIVAIDQAQNEKEAFVQSFSTAKMKRTELIKPVFLEQKVLQTTSNATAISWKTNEKTNATIFYWTDDLGVSKAKKIGVKGYNINHELFVHKLKANERYYFRIEAKDESGNMSTKYFTVNTRDYDDKNINLKITNIEPLSFDKGNIFSRKVIIELKTNLVSKVSIRYGTVPGKYKKKTTVSSFSSLKQRIIINELEPNTTYYYQIITSSGLYRKKFNSGEMSFTTAPLRGALESGSLVKGSGYKVYLISGNEKLWIESGEAFSNLGYKWDWIEQVEDTILLGYKDGKSIKKSGKHVDGTLVRYPNSGTVYLIDGGKKRPISSAKRFNQMGYDWGKIITISTRERYKVGEYL